MGDDHRGFFWWLGVALAPLGIVGGPLAIADTLSGLIEWQGPIGLAVNWWDVNVSDPAYTVFSKLAAMAGLEISAKLSDYLATGLILMFSIMRADGLLGDGLLRVMGRILGPAIVVFLWPVIGGVLLTGIFGPKRLVVIASLLPFFLFLCLWAANAALA